MKQMKKWRDLRCHICRFLKRLKIVFDCTKFFINLMTLEVMKYEEAGSFTLLILPKNHTEKTIKIRVKDSAADSRLCFFLIVSNDYCVFVLGAYIRLIYFVCSI